MPSAPVAVGAIQVPPSGHPIVLLRDGPTVGGYPRLAILDSLEHISIHPMRSGHVMFASR